MDYFNHVSTETTSCFIHMHKTQEKTVKQVKQPVGRPSKHPHELNEVQAVKEDVQVATVLANGEEPTRAKSIHCETKAACCSAC